MHDYYISFLKEGDADYVIYCKEANVIAYFWKNLHLNVNSSGRVLRSKAKFDFLSPTKESKKEIVYIFILGASTFALFEMIGPKVMQITMLLAVAYYFVFNKYDNKNQLSKNIQR